MSHSTAMLGLLAETPLHAGAGQMLGSVDLPIQRESHTQWPCVFGSGVKGALRARATELDVEGIETIFGPDPKNQNASVHAGALAVGDARLLLLPIRSLTGPFRWVTCPAVLSRWQRDLKRLGIEAMEFEVPAVEANAAWIASDGVGDRDGQPFFLEELRLEVVCDDLEQLIEALAKVVPVQDPELMLQRLLCVVDDTVFGDLARFGVPVAAHVRIDSETKTVEDGALWSEETLPSETVLYAPLLASPSRRAQDSVSSRQVLDRLLDGPFSDRPYFQMGGNETVGMGWCQMKSVRGAV